MGNPSFAFYQNSMKQREIDFYSQIDSLKLYPEIFKSHYLQNGFDEDSLATYYHKILTTYQDISPQLSKYQQIYWLLEIGLVQRRLNKLEEAIKTQLSALQVLDKEEDDKAYYFISFQLGDVYRHLGMKKKSNDVFLDLISLPLVESDTSKQMYLYSLVSENYENLGEDEKAMELCIKLYNYNLVQNDLDAASYNLIQMGRISSHLESDTSYFEYYHMANDLAVRSGNKARMINNLTNTGIMYRNAGFPLEGLKYLKRAEKYNIREMRYGDVYLLNALSGTYFLLDSISKGYDFTIKEIEEAKKIKAFSFMYHATMRLVKYYVKVEKFDSAKVMLQEAIKLNRMIDNQSFSSDLYKQLSDMSLRMNDYPSAMAYLDSSYSAYNNQLSKTNNDKLAKLREKSDYYIHRNRISELVSKNKLEQEKTKRWRITVFAILFILALTIYFTLVIRKRLMQLKESYMNLVKKAMEQDKLNKQLRECEVKSKKKSKPENISGEDLIIKNFKIMLYQDEVFMNSQVSLKSLADDLNTNTSYLSAIINSHFHCNLRSLINRHRIEKAREMLVSEEFKHYSMEGISTEVGFSSRSGFYQAFKSSTGLSPSLYIENYNRVISQQNKL